MKLAFEAYEGRICLSGFVVGRWLRVLIEKSCKWLKYIALHTVISTAESAILLRDVETRSQRCVD